MTWHRLPGSLALCIALAACGSSSKNATIDITAPTKGQVLTVKDDVSSSKDGVQYNVTASSSGIAAGTEVVLRISDEGDAPVAKVAGDGAIEFEAVTLPPGKHTLKVVTGTGGVESAGDYDYTLKAIVITVPQNNAAIGYADDKDPDTDGIQINVSVSTYEVELSEDVTLKVDDSTYGSAQHPNANGKLVFSGVTLAEGDHKLKVVAGEAESAVVNISVSTKCATAMFVTPEPPTDGSTLKLGGGDKCPKNGDPFKTDFTVSTDAGDGRDVDLVVNGTLVASTKVNGTLAKFTDVVLDRYKTANKVAVVVTSAQGVTCNPIAYPSDILVDCEGVDCSISAPQPVAGNDDTGKRVLYLNSSSKGKDGFEFEVHTIADAIGQPVKLIIDDKNTDMPSADPSGSDPDVKAKFSALALEDGSHTIQARCELKNGSFGLSRLATWIVDTKACSVSIKTPSADSLLSSTLDSDKNLSGVQVDVIANVSGSDCSASRAAVCDPMTGISDKVGYDSYDGTSPLTSTVTLNNDPSQNLCVEVQDRAGNVGRDSVGVRFNVEAPKVTIESPSSDDKFNSAGGGDYKADSDTGSADVCNANFDVACTQLGAAVKLHRDSATGTVFAMANCEAKGNSDPALPSGYAGRARIKNAAFLPNDKDTAKIVATQTLTVGGKDLTGESTAITLKGDCQKPSLKFSQDPCGGGQLAVQTAQDTVSKNIVAEESTTDTQMATLLVTSGGNQFAMKEANVSNGNYDFGSVNLGGPGSGKRSITIEVSAKDDYDNTGKASCNADIVFDLPTLTVTAPADNAVLVISQNTAGLCTPASGGQYGVTVAATADHAENRSASYSVGTGSDSPLTLNGTAISGCVPIVEGSNDVNIKLTSTSTTAVNKVTRKVTLVGSAPTNGITLNAPTLPSDRNGKVGLTWSVDAPTATKYEMRCDTQALAQGATDPDKTTWWTNARVITLPTDLTPPATSAQVDFRVGENNNCVLRALDAANQGTPITASTQIQVPFREITFTPAQGGNWAGWALAAAGEVSGDSLPDLLVGGGGAAYLVFGSNNSWNGHNSTPDVTIIGRPDGYFAADVAGIGDFNGDGRNDIAIGDPYFNSTAGRVLIYYGRAAATDWGSLPATITVGDNCVADVCINGPAGSQFGAMVKSAGDFDGDGRPDLVIGAPAYLVNGQGVGRAYVLRGKEFTTGPAPAAGQFHNQVVTIDSDNTVEAFRMTGDETGARAMRFLGQTATTLGTFDNTAGADLVFGAPGQPATPGPAVNGGVWYLSGRSFVAGGISDLNLAQLGFRDGSGTPSGTALDTGANFGALVVALGNVVDVASANAPGKVDLGVFNALDTGFYVYTGDTNLAPASKVFVNSRRQYFGEFVGNGRTSGDLDGDGFAEILMSGETDVASGNAPAVPYLFYSDTFKDRFTRRLAVMDPIFTDAASPLNVSAGAGASRRPAEFIGDLNGDGKGDLVVGAPNVGSDPNAPNGEFKILY